MSDLITLRNGYPDLRVGQDEADRLDGLEGFDTENPKGISSRNMSAAQLRQYAACVALDFANIQLALAARLKSNYDGFQAKDSGHFDRINKAKTYSARLGCALPTAKQVICRDIGRKMTKALNKTDMYSSGLKRSIIEDSYAMMVDEAAPLVALAYRDEMTFDDKTYIEARANLVASLDKSSLYIANRAMAAVADTQVELGLFIADRRNQQTLDNIDTISGIVANIEALASNESISGLFKAKSESGVGGERQSDQFGGGAPVRPDNPGGYTPNTGVRGSNVNVGGGAASIPINVPTYTTGR